MRTPYPVPNATTPFWRTELHELDTYRSTPDLPEKQDILIIGAGFAGAALAYHLLKDDSAPKKPSITILEARQACSGATARNGGHLRPDIFNGVASRAEETGLKVATEVGLFELENARAVTELIEAEGIDCDLQQVTSSTAFVDEELAANAKAKYDEMAKLGCATLKEVTYYGPEDAERVCGVKGAKALYTFPGATMWPYKMVMHLLAGDVAQGVNLQTTTPVSYVSGKADGEGYWTLSTPRGDTKAKRVVFATNAYTSGLLPEYRNAIYPARCQCSHVVATHDPGEDNGDAARPLGSSALVTSGLNTSEWYYGLRPDGRSFVGGGGKSAYYWKHRETWYRNFDDSTLIGPAKGYWGGWAERTFRGWEGAATRENMLWTGIMGYTADDTPHIGRVPGRPGLFVCAGFIGHGMPNVLLCAKGLAKLMREDCRFADTGVPACYETTAERLRDADEASARKV